MKAQTFFVLFAGCAAIVAGLGLPGKTHPRFFSENTGTFSPAPESAPVFQTFSKDEFLTALRVVECGDVVDPPDGDEGRSIGPYQIQRGYHVDARTRRTYGDCRDRPYAEKVVDAYMTRYARAFWRESMTLLDCEACARIHNGGPRGRQRPATLPYWNKVRVILEKLR